MLGLAAPLRFSSSFFCQSVGMIPQIDHHRSVLPTAHRVTQRNIYEGTVNLAVKAHGGLDRWNKVKVIKVAAWYVKGKGDFLKDVILTAETRNEHLTVDLPGGIGGRFSNRTALWSKLSMGPGLRPITAMPEPDDEPGDDLDGTECIRPLHSRTPSVNCSAHQAGRNLASKALNSCFRCRSAIWTENCFSRIMYDRSRLNQPRGRADQVDCVGTGSIFEEKIFPFSDSPRACPKLHRKGVFHASSGSSRDRIAFDQTRIAKRTYKIVLPDNLPQGEYAFLAPGLTGSSASGSTGKAYTFRLVE